MFGDDHPLKFGIALFAILNPIGVAPLYLSLTQDKDVAARGRVAALAAFAVFVTLIVMLLAGRQILGVFDISVNDLRIAGGLVVLLIGLSMLRAEAAPQHGGTADLKNGQEKENPAVVPLAIPLLSGPGAMATVIVNSEAAIHLVDKGLMAAVIAVNAVVILVTLRAAIPVQRILGTAGMNVIVRVMGLILAAIAVDMMGTGLRGEFPILASPPSH
ncbi:MAG: NAAT family transporter [Rhodospirillales bacterium]|jgi:multiple antibiotic resistance protein|nr:NAAT family transporter [Rhodospirillales bacterium]